MSIALLFPGQGSQLVGMGRDLAISFPVAKHSFEEANSILGLNFSSVMWEGAESNLADTLNAQPAIYIHSIVAYRVLQTLAPNLKPLFVAGHSLGEFSALTVAGALLFEDGLQLIRNRARIMKRAGEYRPGGMSAILTLDVPIIEKICVEASTADEVVQIASVNCPGQVIISGARPALERAMVLAKQAGARGAIPLAVSIAAHSILMASAQSDWDAAVTSAPLSDAVIPVVGNVTAAPLTNVDDLRAEIRDQLTSRVQWAESIRFMITQDVKTFVEIGNGSVLTNLLKRIDNNVTGFSLSTTEDFNNIIKCGLSNSG